MLFFLRISWHHFCVSSLIGSMIVLFKVLLVMPKQFLVAGFLKIILPFLPLTPLNSPFIAGALHSNNCRSHTLVYNRYGDLTVTYCDHIRTVADPVKFRKLLKSLYFSQAFNIC